MIRYSIPTLATILLLFLGNFALAQDDAAQDASEKLKDQVSEIGETLDTMPAVQDASAGILQPIYQAAEYMAFPTFYWIAFALMVAGVVSFACQLVFSKLFLMLRLHLNIKEIMSDVLGLAISVVGLVLTTQAATQNSSFTQSPLAVVSAAGTGVIVGFVFYLWGQGQEFRAARKPTNVVEKS